MKINLTLGELSEIKKTLVAISEETGETLIQDFKDEIKRSKGLVSYKLKGINVEVEIDNKYTTELLKVYNKYLSIILPATKTFMKGYYSLCEESQEITRKFLDERKDNTEE